MEWLVPLGRYVKIAGMIDRAWEPEQMKPEELTNLGVSVASLLCQRSYVIMGQWVM